MAPRVLPRFGELPSGYQLVNLQNAEGSEFRDTSHLILTNLASPNFLGEGRGTVPP